MVGKDDENPMGFNITPSSDPLTRLKNAANPANHTLLENVLGGLVLVVFIIIIILAALVSAPPPVPTPQCSDRMCLFKTAVTMGNMNTSIDPCYDFYAYSCGSYPQVYPLAPNQGEIRIQDQLRVRNTDKLENILNSPIVDTSVDSYERKVKRTFTNCLNEYTTEKLKGFYLSAELSDKWWLMDNTATDKYDFNALLKITHVNFWSPVFFDWVVRENYLERDKNAIEIHLGGLGMTYVYYYETSQTYVGIRQAYRDYMKTAAQLLVRDNVLPINVPDANYDRFADDVFLIESEIANITRDSEGADPDEPPHDPDNQVTVSEMNLRYQPIDWFSFLQYAFTSEVVNRDTKIVLYEKDYIRLISAMIVRITSANPDGSWKRMFNNYMIWRMIQPHMQDLSTEYIHAARVFYEARTGRSEFASQYEYCFWLTRRMMNKAVSALFVADHFSDSSKKSIDDMFSKLRAVAKESISSNTWFDQETKNKALEKLDAIVEKSGYPELEVDKTILNNEYRLFNVSDGDGSHFPVKLNYYAYARDKFIRNLMNPVDRNQWYGNLYDVAVYMYNPWMELVVPAGILQWPYFTAGVPQFANYGAIGYYIAREIVKSFDIDGQYYDKIGYRNAWWTDKTKLAYTSQTKCMKDYYDDKIAGPYVVNNRDYYVQIKTIMDYRQREVFAAMGGLDIAYKAYIKNVNSEPVLPILNLSAQQGFFVAFAQNLCYARTDRYSFLRHYSRREMPEEFLVNGLVATHPAFAQAFKCKAGAHLNAPKCKVY